MNYNVCTFPQCQFLADTFQRGDCYQDLFELLSFMFTKWSDMVGEAEISLLRLAVRELTANARSSYERLQQQRRTECNPLPVDDIVEGACSLANPNPLYRRVEDRFLHQLVEDVAEKVDQGLALLEGIENVEYNPPADIVRCSCSEPNYSSPFCYTPKLSRDVYLHFNKARLLDMKLRMLLEAPCGPASPHLQKCHRTKLAKMKDNACTFYARAFNLVKHLHSFNLLRVTVTTFLSAFYYDVLDSQYEGWMVAKELWDDVMAAVDEIDHLPEQHYKDVTLHFSLLRDNLTLWGSDLEQKDPKTYQ
eukprot:TRINITY_DN67776_c7_g2_i1.p1 TRINITY_DN67776_c7_g2~~TRINITY_DN67776_c7_g2_i1.p1  ORF type:complete len:305 (+),score=5.83 TRINITY_DN67776_c7_g2_i1:92-1006(+)